MDILVPAVNAVVVAAATLLVVWVGKERSDSLERRMEQGFAQVDKRFEQIGREIGEIRSELAVLRSDLTHVAMAVGARPQPNAG